ncbi:hypothetical protein C8Q77DRAFT_848372 [Trametes polyzona]|nr:hypothetical protein C8Q77DRAFT_848372 [Trametes polyzona]
MKTDVSAMALSALILGVQPHAGILPADAAAVSLFIPFIDPEPITADIVGVDTAKSETTWRIGTGVPSGTFTEDLGELFTSATLVVNPTHVQLVENDPALSFAISADCGFVAGGQGVVCTVVGSAAGTVSTSVVTHVVSAFDVQVAATVSGEQGGATPTPKPSSQPAGQSSGTAATSGDGDATQGSPVPGPSTTAGNGAASLVVSSSFLRLSAGAALAVFYVL